LIFARWGSRWGIYSTPSDPIAVFMGPTSKGGREREGKGERDGKGETVIEGRKGKEGKRK